MRKTVFKKIEIISNKNGLSEESWITTIRHDRTKVISGWIKTQTKRKLSHKDLEAFSQRENTIQRKNYRTKLKQ